jgi:lipopolysaccharide export system permease protein
VKHLIQQLHFTALRKGRQSLFKTFDRYVLGRFVYLFAGFFVAAMGLYAVIDGFTNLDAFQKETEGRGTLFLVQFMSRHYLYRSAWLFDLIGPTLLSFSVIAVLALMMRHGEINPLLAAGVPAYRLAVPLLTGIALIQTLLIANKELVIPRIAAHLSGSHGDSASDGRHVESQFDRVQGMLVSGRELVPASRKLVRPELRLSPPTLVNEFTTLQASEARFYPKSGNEPAGWLLKGVVPQYDELDLTERGQRSIFRQPQPDRLFVATDISWDLLFSGGTAFAMLATKDLIQRVQRPSVGTPLLRAQILHLHSRFTRPLLNVVGMFLVIPLLVRKESRSLVAGIALCMAALGLVVGFSEACQFLGKAALMRPELAVWLPLIIGGGCAAWVSPRVQT